MSARPVEFKVHQTSTQLLKTSQRVSDAFDAAWQHSFKGLDVFRSGSLLQLCKSCGPRARVGSKPPQRLRRPRARHATGQRNPVSCGSDRSGLILHDYCTATSTHGQLAGQTPHQSCCQVVDYRRCPSISNRWHEWRFAPCAVTII